MSDHTPYLIGCGILRREIRHIVQKNGWNLEQIYLPSGLHTDFDRLEKALTATLSRHGGDSGIVFYGACHPLMDRFLTDAGTIRTEGQNCVDIYLGHELFCRELEQGAFFLFEEWALHWREIVCSVFPGCPEIMKAIFRSAHRYILAIRTPCSGDFSTEASAVGVMIGLPVRWIDAGLGHLEATLAKTIESLTPGSTR